MGSTAERGCGAHHTALCGGLASDVLLSHGFVSMLVVTEQTVITSCTVVPQQNPQSEKCAVPFSVIYVVLLG